MSSKKAIEGLQMQKLWNYFYDITQIPRESGNEEAIRAYLIEYAEKHSFTYHVDSVGNLVIKVPATKGMESLPMVALQGHMDMVCVKEEESDYNFETDPLVLVRDGDYLKADKTSLGADNGIAIALMLDLFSDTEAQHGPLEAIITVEEETGLTGAFGLDASLVQSRYMLNLDSEEEGVFYIGCAGGVETDVLIPRYTEDIDSSLSLYTIVVDGLLGGHSGAEIHTQRANAITSLARTLYRVMEECEFHLVRLEGGTKRNVIPSVARATIALSKQDAPRLEGIVQRVEKTLQKEFALADPDISVRCIASEEEVSKGSSVSHSNNIIKALLLAPHGVHRMSDTIEGMVETSSNLAIIETKEDSISVISSHRSAVESARDYIANISLMAFDIADAQGEIVGAYPAWTPNPHSALAQMCAASWEKAMGSKARITAIHAGLECGIINSLVDGMDSVSFGPSMEGVHSTQERLSISSTERIALFLRSLLTQIQ